VVKGEIGDVVLGWQMRSRAIVGQAMGEQEAGWMGE
jgi:hypothetical protein